MAEKNLIGELDMYREAGIKPNFSDIAKRYGKDGVVAEQGTPAQLKAAGGEFARMVALQKEAATWQL